MAERRNLWILLGIVAIVGVGSWLLGGRTPHLPQAPLGAVPAGTTAVLHVDVEAVLGSVIWQRLVVDRGGDTGVRRIEELCGGDPLGALTEVTAFASGSVPGDLERVGLIARGAFDAEDLGSCVRRVVEADGGSLRQITIAGVPAVAGRGASRAAFIGADGIAGGDEEVVTAIVRAVRGDEPSAARDPVLARLWTMVARGRDIVFVAHIPGGWRRALQERLRASTDASLDSIAGARAFGLGAALGGGLGAEAVLSMRDEPNAAQAARALEGLIEGALDGGGLATAVTRPLVRQLAVEARGHDVHLTLNLSAERLDRTLSLLLAIWDTPTRDRGAPQRLEPTPDAIIERDE